MISRDPKAVEKDSAVYERLKEYKKIFDEVHVVVMAKRKSTQEFQEGNLYIYPAFSKISFFAFLSCLSYAFEAARKIGKDKWISVQDPFEAGIVGLIVKKVFGGKLQVQIHTDLFSPMYKKSGLKERKNLFLAGLTLTEAYSIRVVSDKVRDDTKKYLTKYAKEIPMYVLPIIVDFEKLEEMKKKAIKENYGNYDSTVLVVSRLEKEKNVSLAIKAFADLRKSGENAVLVIAGEGSEREKLKHLSGRLEIAEHVKFLGFENDLSSVYISTDVLLSTSLYEGFGMVFLEAALFGKPIVSTDVGIAKEIGAHIADWSAEDLALKIKEALTEKQIDYDLSKFKISKDEYLNRFRESFDVLK